MGYDVMIHRKSLALYMEFTIFSKKFTLINDDKFLHKLTCPPFSGAKARTRTFKAYKRPATESAESDFFRHSDSEPRVDMVARRFKKNVGTPGNLWKSLENSGWDSNDIANIG